MHINLHETIIVEEERGNTHRYTEERIPNKLWQALDIPDSSAMELLCNFNLEYVIYSLLLEEVDANHLYASTQLLIQSAVIQYLSIFKTKTPDSVYLGNRLIDVPYKEPQALITVRPLPITLPTQLFYWSLICQSEKVGNILLDHDYSPFLKEKGWEGDYLRAHYQFTRLILQGDIDKARVYYETLFMAYEELPPVIKMHPRFYLPLWKAILDDDEAGFNERLSTCLLEFKRDWSDTSDSDPYVNNDIYGHFSLEITALIKVAKLRGYTVHTTSDYTPSFFTDPDFVLDMDTRLDWYYEPQKMEIEILDLEALLRENQIENQEKKK